jgi:hypothetical protein
MFTQEQNEAGPLLLFVKVGINKSQFKVLISFPIAS